MGQGQAIEPDKAAAAIVLSAAGYRPSQIAPLVGISRPSVYDIIGGHRHWGALADKPVFDRLRREQQQILETSYRQSAAELLAHAMEPAKLDKGSTYQLVIASKIALEASRLLAGESTANIDIHVQVQSVDELANALSQAILVNQTVDNSQNK